MTMRILPLVGLGLMSCGSSEPTENYGAREATLGLEQLGRGDRSCTCSFDDQTDEVWLSCIDSSYPDLAEGNQMIRFGFLSRRGQRRLSYVDWVYELVGSDVEYTDNIGLVVSQLGPAELDRRGEGLSTWAPLYIERMRVDAIGACTVSDCPIGDGGYLREGHYWCTDTNTDPWDIDPDWRRFEPLRPSADDPPVWDGGL